ncbi:MAG: DNA recombination protein RmuC [Halobacteria archaeon]
MKHPQVEKRHMVNVVSAITVVLLLVVIALLFLVYRSLDREGVNTDQLTSALARSFDELGFESKVSDIQHHAGEIEELHTDIERMLSNPRERGDFGERQLETILDNHLPPDTYGVRKQVVDGKTPDAYIESPEGVICIDSKFPLENYENYVGAESEDLSSRYAREFRQDVEKQLEKIASDYVAPESGTVDFAFAFIPSEAVYYHLVSREYGLLQSYVKQGVQVVSPLTLGQKLELIKAGIQAERLSREAREIKRNIGELRSGFQELGEELDTLEKHVRNAEKKTSDVDRRYRELRDSIETVDEPREDG